jgi:secreted Zn-dependent insulinase-like peptidase
VRKLDANTYSTAMTGFKYKLAHKRADSEKWNVGYSGQRKKLIKLFQSFIHQLELEEIEDAKNKKAKKTVSKEKEVPPKISKKRIPSKK